MLRPAPTAIDLFCGCGGLTLGLRRAGYKVVAAIDNDPLAINTYRKNHSPVWCVGTDIRKVNPRILLARLGIKKGQLSLLAGCPPCQGFSSLRTLNGREKVDDPMNDLVFQFLRFAMVFKPKTMMMENVPGLAIDNRMERFGARLRDMGYKHRIKVVDAAEYELGCSDLPRTVSVLEIFRAETPGEFSWAWTLWSNYALGLAISLAISLALYGIVRAIGWVIGGFVASYD